MGDSVCAPKLGSAESLESLSNRTMELAPLPVTGSPEAPAHTLRDLSLYASPAKAPLDLNASKPVQQPRSAPHKQPASACYDFKARSWVDVATQEDLRHGRGPVDYRAEVLKTVDRAASFVQTDGPVNHVAAGRCRRRGPPEGEGRTPAAKAQEQQQGQRQARKRTSMSRSMNMRADLHWRLQSGTAPISIQREQPYFSPDSDMNGRQH
eukprot:scaffold452_cov235-Pinguiococcus_pyrenoidosus.AAC.5